MSYLKHEPESKDFRVAVIRKTDSVQVGSMPAKVGMVLVHGSKIVKVNEKSVLTEDPGCQGKWRKTHLMSVYLQEARKFGFNG
jgi:hypothetical protein